MPALLVIEGLGLLYCLYCWIRDHPRSRNEWVISVGIRISHLTGRREISNVNAECSEMLFPDASREEQQRLYTALRVGGVLLWLLIGNAVFLMAMYMEKPEVFPGIQLERPAYGEDPLFLEYQLSVKADGKTKTETVDVKVPGQQPTEEELNAQFEEAEYLIGQIFESFISEKQEMDLPEQYKEISIRYESEDPQILRNDGEVFWENIEEEVTVQMTVEFSNDEKRKEKRYELRLQPPDKSLQDAIEDVQSRLENGEYLTEEELLLPLEEDGVEYEWSLVQDKNHLWMGVLWIGVLPLLICILRDQERKRKLRIRKERIRQRYPDMLNKLMILMGAGMSITKAWLKITEDYTAQKIKYNQEEPLYEEMLHAGLRLNNGYSMSEVIRIFAQRNSIREIQQFCGILQTGWKRGDAHVLLHLKDLHDRSWDIRKRTARKLSEEADTKLLLPLMLMLMVVMIIVLAPAMMTMKM